MRRFTTASTAEVSQRESVPASPSFPSMTTESCVPVTRISAAVLAAHGNPGHHAGHALDS